MTSVSVILNLCVLCEQWLELVLGWLSKVFASEADGDSRVPAPSAPSAPGAPAAPGAPGAPGAPSLGAGQPASSVLKQWRCHMHQFFCRIYVNMRIEELFSIIRGERGQSVVHRHAHVHQRDVSHVSVSDFPESKAAIEDLKFCLERTNQRQQLLTSLKSAFESRLLHPGESENSTVCSLMTSRG